MALISLASTQLGSSCTSPLENFLSSKQFQLELPVKTSSLKVLTTSSSSSHCFSCKFPPSPTSCSSSPSSSSSSAAATRSPQSAQVAHRHGHARAHSSSSSSSSSSTSSVTDSPFTERSSPKKSRGRGFWSNVFPSPAERDSQERDKCCTVSTTTTITTHFSAFQAQEDHLSKFSESAIQEQEREQDGIFSERGVEMSSQLPELREVLTMLRQRWEEEAASGRRKRGPGNVFLVGTGPGDPELLTVKALRLMQSADLVLYDRLVSTDILDLVHAGARLLYVGKTSGFHSRTQEEIHELLLNFADAGATVVRLKGGDPLVFGRGGEEMEFLQDQGIQVNVIPGITAASGIAAELGIPMTHRGLANSVRFLTGHSRKGGDDPLYVAEQAADPDSTLVIYMGLASLPGLAAKLMANGLSPDTPAAAVERGTTPQQRMVFGTLQAVPTLVAKAELVSPTLIFIGKVVALSPHWHSTVEISEASSRRNKFVDDRSTPSLTLTPGTNLAAGLEREPRERRRRGPDPALPSQL